MKQLISLILVGLTFGVSGCGTNDSVVFATRTQVGLDADTSSGTINIGYDRTAGLIGPAYETGAAPPVVATIKSDLSAFAPKIKQLYATGEAARIVTDPNENRSKPKEKLLQGERRVMFFGTTSNVGLKLGFNPGGIEGLSFGYKRKEFSRIPIGKKERVNKIGLKEPTDVYASVLAWINIETAVNKVGNSGFSSGQFFATGDAAENLASQKNVKAQFTNEALRYAASFTTSTSSTTVAAWLDRDTGNRNKLAGWLRGEGLNVSSTLFTFGAEYEDARPKAIKDLNMKP